MRQFRQYGLLLIPVLLLVSLTAFAIYYIQQSTKAGKIYISASITKPYDNPYQGLANIPSVWEQGPFALPTLCGSVSIDILAPVDTVNLVHEIDSNRLRQVYDTYCTLNGIKYTRPLKVHVLNSNYVYNDPEAHQVFPALDRPGEEGFVIEGITIEGSAPDGTIHVFLATGWDGKSTLPLTDTDRKCPRLTEADIDIYQDLSSAQLLSAMLVRLAVFYASYDAADIERPRELQQWNFCESLAFEKDVRDALEGGVLIRPVGTQVP